MRFKWFSGCVGAVVLLTAAGAQANLLTNADFESNDFYSLLTVPGQWGGEFNSSLVGAEYGVTPFSGSQMLSIGDAGGGGAAQVAQEVSGPFSAGSTVTFDVRFNAKTSGALAYTRLWFDSWGGASSVQTNLALDGNASTWETLTLTTVLAANVTKIFAEIWTPIVSGAPQGYYVEFPGQYLYADDAVLTVTPAAVPAPSALSLLLLALLALGAGHRRKQSGH